MSDIVVSVRVKTKARSAAWEVQPDGSVLASLLSPPVDGKANAELIALCARHYGVAKSEVEIKSGAASKLKRLRVIWRR